MSSSLRPSRYAAAAAPSTAAAPSSPSKTSSDRSALAYLLRYETLVRSQDVEDAATSDHLRPLFDRLIVLGGGGTFGATENGKTSSKAIDADIPGLIPSHSASTDEGDLAAVVDTNPGEHIFTYDAMRVALAKLGAEASMAPSDAKYSNGGDGTSEVLTTDRQCMLLLRTIVDANGSLNNDDESGNPAGLTYAEFLQVYKVIVGGMQTLQRIPKKEGDDAGSTASSISKNDTRLKIRERTLNLIKLFGPSNAANNKSINNNPSDDASCSSSVSSLPSLPGKGWKKVRKGMATRSGASSNSSTGRGGKYRDPTDLPRDSTFSTLSVASVASTITDAEDVRRVLTIKDKTMRNLLSDHAGEMDDLTTKMVDMSRKNKRRKGRMVTWGVAMGVLGLSIGLIVGNGRSAITPSSTSTSAHQPDLLLANELKYTKRELGLVNARVSKLQNRLVDAESDARTATNQLYDCRSNLAAVGGQVDDLKVSGSGTSTKAIVPVMKQASSAMAGASGAVLFPQIAKAVASGSLRALAAAGGGMWAGIGLLVGAIISGAVPSLVNRNK